MMFRDLKAGDTIYLYDRVAIALTTEKVVSDSAPHIDKNNMSVGMVVDIAVANMTYTFKDSSEIGFTSNLAISSDKSNLLREVEVQKASNESQIARVDQLRAELPKLTEIIDQLNPEAKAKKMMEDRLSKIEASLEKLLNANLKPMTNGSK